MNRQEREQAFRKDFDALMEKHGAKFDLYVDHNEYREEIAALDVVMSIRLTETGCDEFTAFELGKGDP